MAASIPGLLPHARKPPRERTQARHAAPGLKRESLLADRKGRIVRKPIFASVALHALLVSGAVALCLSERHPIRHFVEQGRGGINLVLQPAVAPTAPSAPDSPSPAVPDLVSKTILASTAVPEAVPVLPPVAPPIPRPLSVPSMFPHPVPHAAPKPKASPATASAQSTPSSRGAITLSRSDYARNPAPVYPEAARAAGQQGTVSLDVQISTQGTVDAVSIHHSSGYTLLDRAAVTAVRHWKFPSGRASDSSCTVRVPIRFNLEQGSDE